MAFTLITPVVGRDRKQTLRAAVPAGQVGIMWDVASKQITHRKPGPYVAETTVQGISAGFGTEAELAAYVTAQGLK